MENLNLLKYMSVTYPDSMIGRITADIIDTREDIEEKLEYVRNEKTNVDYICNFKTFDNDILKIQELIYAAAFTRNNRTLLTYDVENPLVMKLIGTEFGRILVVGTLGENKTKRISIDVTSPSQYFLVIENIDDAIDNLTEGYIETENITDEEYNVIENILENSIDIVDRENMYSSNIFNMQIFIKTIRVEISNRVNKEKLINAIESTLAHLLEYISTENDIIFYIDNRITDYNFITENGKEHIEVTPVIIDYII